MEATLDRAVHGRPRPQKARRPGPETGKSAPACQATLMLPERARRTASPGVAQAVAAALAGLEPSGPAATAPGLLLL